MFACTRKERQISRAGTPYLTVELRDSTRQRSVGRAFRDADLLAGALRAGRARARARARPALPRRAADRRPRDRPRRGRAQADPHALPADRLPRPRRARRLPRAPRARGLRPRAAGAAPGAARRPRAARAAAARALLAATRAAGPGQALARRARRPPAVRSGRAQAHHAYLGGLLEHTVAVATMALELCTLHPRLDRDLLLCAAIVHDLGKTREFTYGAEIDRSREGRLLGHIELGLRVIAAHMPASARRRAPARARALRDAPPRPRRSPPGSASPRPRRSRCYPPERARRAGQGRARARWLALGA